MEQISMLVIMEKVIISIPSKMQLIRLASLNPNNENARVTIRTYDQQVMIQTPYITFVNDEPSKGDAVLTWYFGIGYK